MNFNFFNVNYDRSDLPRKTAQELKLHVDNFTELGVLAPLYTHFQVSYGLPREVVRQRLRQHMARSWRFGLAGFRARLKLRFMVPYAVLYLALFYGLFFSKKQRQATSHKLIIDGLQAPHELLRFGGLINEVGASNILAISNNVDIRNVIEDLDVDRVRLFKRFDRRLLINSITVEFLRGIWIVALVSLKSRVNLFPISLQIIHSYLLYKTIFRSSKAPFLIQERHYNTDAVKNFLFKQEGGVAPTSIQKNIFHADPINFYIDIDRLYPIGSEGWEEMAFFSERIGKVVPVGSMFMEHYWFEAKLSKVKELDILVLGINATNEFARLNSYDQFENDYYCLSKWVARLSKDFPTLRIAVKHHASAGKVDVQEKEILAGTNVLTLDKTLNSYHVAFKSRLAVTHGSTMGYELNGHNLPTIFVDQGSRCGFLPEPGNFEYVDKVRATNYSEFFSLVQLYLNDQNKPNQDANAHKWCLESSYVSSRIFEDMKKLL